MLYFFFSFVFMVWCCLFSLCSCSCCLFVVCSVLFVVCSLLDFFFFSFSLISITHLQPFFLPSFPSYPSFLPLLYFLSPHSFTFLSRCSTHIVRTLSHVNNVGTYICVCVCVCVSPPPPPPPPGKTKRAPVLGEVKGSPFVVRVVSQSCKHIRSYKKPSAQKTGS